MTKKRSLNSKEKKLAQGGLARTNYHPPNVKIHNMTLKEGVVPTNDWYVSTNSSWTTELGTKFKHSSFIQYAKFCFCIFMSINKK